MFLLLVGVAVGGAVGYYVEKAKGDPENRNMEAGPIHKIGQKGGGAFLTFCGLYAAAVTPVTGG